MEREVICSLHSSSVCNSRGGYGDVRCRLERNAPFATCKYRIEAVVLAAAEPVESPENVVQQPQPKSADEMQVEVEAIF